MKYKGVKIIIKNTNYNFSYHIVKFKGCLIIIYGASCINKSTTLHKAIKKTRINS